jgi:type VI protein secretion system component VasK
MLRRMMLAAVPVMAIALVVGCDSGDTKKATNATPPAGAPDMKKMGQDMMAKGKEGMEKGKEAVSDAGKAVAEKGKEAAAVVGDVAKEGVLKPINEFMGKIEEKVKGMAAGDAATAAKAKLDAFKKMVEEFKAAPGEKVKELGEKLATAFAELKKLVGL